jgi:hypothetical protein
LNHRILFAVAVCSLLTLLRVRAQNPPSPTPSPGTAASLSGTANEAEFRKLVAQVIERRSNGSEHSEGTSSEELAALGILDSLVLDVLNAADDAKLEGLNQRLATLVTQNPPVSQRYVVLRLGGSPEVFALAANFGSSGPSAARFYVRGPDKYRMAARIDPAVQPDYFDDYLQILPLPEAQPTASVVFVTVTGRTDEFATGVFAAWRLADDRLQEVWVTDLLPRSMVSSSPTVPSRTKIIRAPVGE